MPLFFAGLLSQAKRLPILWWVIIALALLLLGTCAVHKIGDSGKVSRGEVVRDQNAREGAATSRIEDKGRQDQMKEDLNEAVASLPDNVPSDRRIALACQRLRNDGHTVLPASCRPAPDRQAPPRPG